MAAFARLQEQLTAGQNESMRQENLLRSSLAAIAFITQFGCATTNGVHVDRRLENAEYLPVADVDVQVPSLSSCTSAQDVDLRLSRHEPVTVFVHGCFASMGQFRSLADVFAFHGQQTVCFNYDDRDSLEVSSAQLIRALEALSKAIEAPAIDVVGHSQGGLVARRALIDDRPDRFAAENVDVRLTTISAPFGGISAASHCGSKVLAWVSLGLVKPICRLITGKKYKEIPPNSKFMLDPGELLPAVNKHVKIETDETDSCRRYDDRGVCVEDDYVFSLEEQSQPALAGDAALSLVVVKSGHVAIVGDVDTAPTKLISVLQQQGVLDPTPARSRAKLAELLARLYPSASSSGR
jgi:PGAP1-like protein